MSDPLESPSGNAMAGDAGLLRRVDRAVGDLRRGTPVVLHRDGTAAVVQACEAVAADGVAEIASLTGEAAVLAITARRARALGLDGPDGAAAVSTPVAALSGAELRALADPTAPAQDAARRLDGAATADDLADAAIQLAKLAELLPAAVVSALDCADARAWAQAHGLIEVGVDEVAAYRGSAARSLRHVADSRVPLAGAENTRIHAFRPADGGVEHLAIVVGEPRTDAPVLARLHSECFTGDLLGSLRCDCGEQLRGAIATMAEAGGGVLLYLAQEGRGIGLVNKLRAYRLQDCGADTLEANEALGFDPDERLYQPAAEMLRQLGYRRVRLLTNNPEKVAALTQWGITVVERVPHHFPSNTHNAPYLSAKARRFGHLY